MSNPKWTHEYTNQVICTHVRIHTHECLHAVLIIKEEWNGSGHIQLSLTYPDLHPVPPSLCQESGVPSPLPCPPQV